MKNKQTNKNKITYVSSLIFHRCKSPEKITNISWARKYLKVKTKKPALGAGKHEIYVKRGEICILLWMLEKWYIHFLWCLKGDFFLTSKFLHLVIISFILVTMCDLRLILLGEIRCWSLSGFNGLKRIYRVIMSIPLWASVQAARAAVAAETSGDVMERARLLSLWGEPSFSSGNSSASSKLDQLIGLGRKLCWRINFIRIILLEISI